MAPGVAPFAALQNDSSHLVLFLVLARAQKLFEKVNNVVQLKESIGKLRDDGEGQEEDKEIAQDWLEGRPQVDTLHQVCLPFMGATLTVK